MTRHLGVASAPPRARNFELLTLFFAVPRPCRGLAGNDERTQTLNTL